MRGGLTGRYGWGPRGRRLVEAAPAGHWHASTVVAAIGVGGVGAAMVLDGPMTGAGFALFCEWLLAPTLSPGDVVVLDNLSSHYDRRALAAIRAAGATALHLPPYSPDLNPIEQVISKAKRALARLRPRSWHDLGAGVGRVLRRVTVADCVHCIHHSGYRVTDKLKTL